MNSREAIKIGLDMGEYVAMTYLNDLSDGDLMRRPHPGCNHINWQVGHIVAAEHQMLSKIRPGAMPPLPAGFAEKYSKETASSNDPAAFAKKDELMKVYKSQRAATLALMDKLTDDELDMPTGVDYAPTVASMLSLQSSHWLMHCGQWVIVRRELGKPVVI